MSRIERSDRAGVTVIKINGPLTVHELGEVEGPFAEATRPPGARVVVDLSGVDIVTTPALTMFIVAAEGARQTGGRVIFTETRPPVQDVVTRLRLNAVLRSVPAMEDAVAEARK